VSFCVLTALGHFRKVWSSSRPLRLFDDQRGALNSDNSFNEGVYNGVKTNKNHTTDAAFRFERVDLKMKAQVGSKVLPVLQNEAYSPIVTVGFNMTSAVEKCAMKVSTKHNFTLIDGVIRSSNVQLLSFKSMKDFHSL